MRILDALRMTRTTAVYDEAITAAAFDDPSTYPYASPFSPAGDLHRLVFEDVFGPLPINTRAAAMRIPAVARARSVMVTAVARNPLRAYDAEQQLVPNQPTWTYRTNSATGPRVRMAWTVDDLIFYGWSCWWRHNGFDRFMLDGGRVPQESWTLDADLNVLIDGQRVRDDQVLLIPGLHEGILTYGVDALADARTLYANVRRRLNNPVPTLNLQQVDGEPLTDAEIDKLIDRWVIARRGANGGVSFTNKSVKPEEMGTTGEQLLIDARNAAALDIARVIGVSGSKIDATVDKASLNYETTAGRNREFVDFDLALYTLPIEERLSQDDVLPRGQHIAFDLEHFTTPTPAPTGPDLDD